MDDQRNAGEELFRNFHLLDFRKIEQRNIDKISLIITQDYDFRKTEGYFETDYDNNELKIICWADNFQNAVECISAYWAVVRAHSDPTDEYYILKSKYLRNYWLTILFASLITLIDIFYNTFFILPAIGTVFTIFYVVKWIKIINHSIKDSDQKVREFLLKLNYKPTSNFVIKALKQNEAKIMKKTHIFLAIFNICWLGFVIELDILLFLL